MKIQVQLHLFVFLIIWSSAQKAVLLVGTVSSCYLIFDFSRYLPSSKKLYLSWCFRYSDNLRSHQLRDFSLVLFQSDDETSLLSPKYLINFVTEHFPSSLSAASKGESRAEKSSMPFPSSLHGMPVVCLSRARAVGTSRCSHASPLPPHSHQLSTFLAIILRVFFSFCMLCF